MGFEEQHAAVMQARAARAEALERKRKDALEKALEMTAIDWSESIEKVAGVTPEQAERQARARAHEELDEILRRAPRMPSR